MYERPPHGIYGPQPHSPGEQPSNLGNFGLGIGAAGAIGFLPTKTGRVWDKYISGVRAAETAFPGAILRTFRVSEVLSPLESYSKVAVSKEQIAKGGKYAEYLKSVFGAGIDHVELGRNGFAFGTIQGTGGKAIGEGLQILAGTQKGSTIADYYARLHGVDIRLEGVGGAKVTDSLNDSLLRLDYQASGSPLSFHEWVEQLSPQERHQRLILGAKYRESINIFGKKISLDPHAQRRLARVEVLFNLARAKSATTAGRLNTLLRAPLELPVIGEAISKIPFLNIKAGIQRRMPICFVRGLVRGL